MLIGSPEGTFRSVMAQFSPEWALSAEQRAWLTKDAVEYWAGPPGSYFDAVVATLALPFSPAELYREYRSRYLEAVTLSMALSMASPR